MTTQPKTALLEALENVEVSHLFCNLGSDYPANLEAISKGYAEGKTEYVLFTTASHESVGLSAAQRFFQARGKMQAIIVHVDAERFQRQELSTMFQEHPYQSPR